MRVRLLPSKQANMKMHLQLLSPLLQINKQKVIVIMRKIPFSQGYERVKFIWASEQLQIGESRKTASGFSHREQSHVLPPK